MKVTFDTKEDTHEDFEKVIRMLQAMKREKIMHSDVFDDTGVETLDTKQDIDAKEEQPTGALFNMFSDPTPETTEPEVKEEPTEVKEEPVEDTPKVQVYEY